MSRIAELMFSIKRMYFRLMGYTIGNSLGLMDFQIRSVFVGIHSCRNTTYSYGDTRFRSISFFFKHAGHDTYLAVFTTLTLRI